jgi:hypothetical protein
MVGNMNSTECDARITAVRVSWPWSWSLLCLGPHPFHLPAEGISTVSHAALFGGPTNCPVSPLKETLTVSQGLSTWGTCADEIADGGKLFFLFALHPRMKPWSQVLDSLFHFSFKGAENSSKNLAEECLSSVPPRG